MRVRARFDAVCENDMALPGSGMTPATVEACASTLDRSPCELPGGPPSACNFHGSLSGGMPCNEGLQCQSGSCHGTAAFSPGGQIGPNTCGTCDPVAAVGQVCASGMFLAGCTQDAICVTSNTSASMPTYTCTALAQGSVGAPCDDLAAICKTGFYCSAQTHMCTTLGRSGAPCGEGPQVPGDPGGCAAPLSCVGRPGMATCGSVGAGAFCLAIPIARQRSAAFRGRAPRTSRESVARHPERARRSRGSVPGRPVTDTAHAVSWARAT